MKTRVRWPLPAGLLVAGVLAASPPAMAQGTGDGFLFHAPTGSFVVRGGYDEALAGSDIFAQAISDLTLSKRDFGGLSFSGELAANLTPRWDLVFAAGWSGSSHGSEYRSWVDNVGLPIQQTTTFQRVPLTAGARYYLLPRGEMIGHLAWVPSRFAPYLGGGVGAIWYRFRQYGDFIDLSSATKDVFTDDLNTSDWSPMAYAAAGVDFSLTPRIFLTGEGRYTWARGHVGPAYSGFGNMDLSGVAVTIGVGFRM
jgi:opacity protein-like surface antigen